MPTITQRGDTYKITVSCGYDLSGKQIRRHLTWKPEDGMTARQIKKELDRQAVLFEEKCRNGQVLDGNMKFAEFAEKWFAEYAEKQLRATTVARYRLLMPRINAAIGHIRLDKLQPHHLMSFYNNLGESGVREDTRYCSAIDFKALLKKRGMTKRAFAEQAGVSVYVLDSVTRGANINAASAHKITTALQLPLDKVFQPAGEKDTLAVSTVLHHHRLISSMLSTAVKWQLIFSNPCSRVVLPKNKHKEAVYLDEEQAADLLAALDKESMQHQVIVKLLLFTGMRRGELCGLEWKDVDFERAVIFVRRSSLYLPGKGVFEDETKNETSERCMKVSADVVTMLKAWRTAQSKQRLRMGDQWQTSDRLFTAWDGAPIRPDVITAWFHKFVTKNGLPPIHIHSLRHTNATLLIAAGTSLTTVAARLGHANSTTTSKIYAHAIKSADQAAAEVLQDILHPVKRQA